MIVKEAVLKLGDLQTLHDTMMSEKFPWFYHPHQASVKDSSYFYHPFYWSHNIQSDYFNLVAPLIEYLKPIAIINIRANLVINKGKEIKSSWHVDQYNDLKLQHKTAIFYVNSNNGGTLLGDELIQSKANRILIMKKNLEHASVGPTDEKRRIVININYILYDLAAPTGTTVLE